MIITVPMKLPVCFAHVRKTELSNCFLTCFNVALLYLKGILLLVGKSYIERLRHENLKSLRSEAP